MLSNGLLVATTKTTTIVVNTLSNCTAEHQHAAGQSVVDTFTHTHTYMWLYTYIKLCCGQFAFVRCTFATFIALQPRMRLVSYCCHSGTAQQNFVVDHCLESLMLVFLLLSLNCSAVIFFCYCFGVREGIQF